MLDPARIDPARIIEALVESGRCEAWIAYRVEVSPATINRVRRGADPRLSLARGLIELAEDELGVSHLVRLAEAAPVRAGEGAA